MEAIILAGGFGTRLKSVVSDVPKPMAPISNKPFLCYIFDYLAHQKITKVVLSVGYQYEIIMNYFKYNYNNITIEYSIEHEPLGTGGGIRKAFGLIKNENVFIINGDTFFKVNFTELYEKHKFLDSDLTLSLKPLNNYDRYGSIVISENKILEFNEKKHVDSGYINGGIYLAKSSLFNKFDLPEKFSFEKDFMEKKIMEIEMNGYISNSYFIDIGIPEDYKKANFELQKEIYG